MPINDLTRNSNEDLQEHLLQISPQKNHLPLVKQNISADLLSICTKEIKLLCVAKRIGNTSCNHQPMDYFDRLSTHYGIQKRKKFIFNHPILTSVWFWPSNSKTGYLWPSNYQNRSNLTIRLFWWVVLIFLFTIKFLNLKMIITFCPYLR